MKTSVFAAVLFAINVKRKRFGARGAEKLNGNYEPQLFATARATMNDKQVDQEVIIVRYANRGSRSRNGRIPVLAFQRQVLNC